jgi:hypothetical protein
LKSHGISLGNSAWSVSEEGRLLPITFLIKKDSGISQVYALYYSRLLYISQYPQAVPVVTDCNISFFANLCQYAKIKQGFLVDFSKGYEIMISTFNQ